MRRDIHYLVPTSCRASFDSPPFGPAQISAPIIIHTNPTFASTFWCFTSQPCALTSANMFGQVREVVSNQSLARAHESTIDRPSGTFLGHAVILRSPASATIRIIFVARRGDLLNASLSVLGCAFGIARDLGIALCAFLHELQVP